jgi:hypothetical protein
MGKDVRRKRRQQWKSVVSTGTGVVCSQNAS